MTFGVGWVMGRYAEARSWLETLARAEDAAQKVFLAKTTAQESTAASVTIVALRMVLALRYGGELDLSDVPFHSPRGGGKANGTPWLDGALNEGDGSYRP